MDELIAAAAVVRSFVGAERDAPAVVVPYDDYAAADVAAVVVKDELEALED